MPVSPAEFAYEFPRSTKVIVVLDVVESVRVMEQDEHGFVQRWHNFVEHAREILPSCGGRMHKSLGDGLMLEFDDAQGAVRSSFALQQWCREDNTGRPPELQMLLRVGAHLCEFVSDQYDIYGTDVNLTARIATLAGPGEIVVSAGLRDQLTAGLDADIEDLGECHLKHVKEPLRAYRIGPEGDSPVLPAHASHLMNLLPTVAVIPFATRSSDMSHRWLGEALADEVIAALSRTQELHVISRLSTSAFRERSGATDAIREHLKANYILAGECRSHGDSFSLFVELIDSKSQRVMWADTFKGKVEGLFSPHDDLIGRLVGQVSSAMVRQELDRANQHALPTLEGYTLLLGAVALMHRTQFSDFNRAHQMLEHLVDRTRRHPAPSAWLAYWHVMRVQQGWAESPQKETELAMSWAKKALDNDPHSTLALTVDGLVHTNLLKDPEAGIERYATALDVNPNESLAWLLKGMAETFLGNASEGLQCAEHALKLSPLDPLRYFYDSLAASIAVPAGQFERAIELAQRSLRANRTHTSTYRALAIAQSMIGRTDDARITVQKLLALEPTFSVSEFLRRVPAQSNPLVTQYADALRRAGLPR